MADMEVDARGLSCPEPVLLAKNALESMAAGTVVVLVETVTSRENVTRLARGMGCAVEVEEAGDEFRMTIRKG